MKNGLVFENGELIYYVNDLPKHEGIVKDGNDIYYIGKGGKAVKGVHIVHREMSNGIVERGTYTFGDDYKLVEGSFIAPVKLSRKKKRKFRLTSKVSKWLSIAAALLVAAFVATVAIQEHWISRKYIDWNDNSSPNINSSENVLISLPEFDEPVLLCSESAKQLYDNEIDIVTAVRKGDPYRPFEFEYALGETSADLYISEHKNMSDAKRFFLDKKKNVLKIDNLKTATRYYYTVSVGNDEFSGEFVTADSTRFINIPGAYNTRDIGGYRTLDGKTVKQGLLIRGVEIDGLVEHGYYIPQDELTYIKDTFGFVYDFDLRGPDVYAGDYRSPLEEKVGHAFYNSVMYGEIFKEQAIPILKNIFSDLADPEKYPMYLHCTYGTDRTGTIIYLLQGVLGMSEKDMEREYKMTGYFSSPIAESDYIEVVYSGLQAYEGDTLGEKIVRFLVDTVGVTENEIESIRNILLED